ncbi:hypothetical protein, partial [Pseudomonas sp. NPDC087639]|uniref:hypothetical protein n=1 Tax=Pseudomonas sp. NPDC087639 TaxID=3364445 RepID=UPI0038192B65
YNGQSVPPEGVPGGMHPYTPVVELKKLANGARLRIEFKVGYGGNTDEAKAVTFPDRVYIVRAALDLTAPGIKEAPNGTSLDPFAAKDALTAVIPAYPNMIGTQVTVTWAGTAGSGSQTVGPINVNTQGNLNIPLSNAVVAFNLGKTVTVTYIVTGNDTPSDPLVLSVLPIANEDTRLPSPIINGNTTTELDVNTLPVQPLTRIDAWPLIKEGQPIWLRYFVDGNPTPISVTYNGQSVPPEGVPGGMHPYTPVVELKKLANGARLRIEFKVGYGGDTDEAKAVTFPQRTYTVKAVEDVKPEITSVKGSPSGVEIPPNGTTEETAVILTGSAAKGQKVEVFDGTTPKGQPIADLTTGIWTHTVTGLSVGEHSFKAKALYGSEQESEARALAVAPELIVDTSTMVISGRNLSIEGTGLTWARTGQDPAGTTALRSPSSGVPPYTYRSNDSGIASVEATTGLVRSEWNGMTRITVTDSLERTASFEVRVSNVFKPRVNLTHLSHPQAYNWRVSIGGTLLTDGDMPLFIKYKSWTGHFNPVLTGHQPIRDGENNGRPNYQIRYLFDQGPGPKWQVVPPNSSWTNDMEVVWPGPTVCF